MKKTILLLSFIGCCFAAFSKDIYVDGSSSGTQDGSALNPYRTIQAAVNAAANGDVVKVAKGTYSEAVKIERKVSLLGGYAGGGNFTAANPQTNITVLKGTSAAPCILVEIWSAASGSMTISGFTIREGERGIKLDGVWSGSLNNITIENNIIENNGTQNTGLYGGGIGLEGNNVKILNNVIRNNTAGRGAAIGVTSDLINVLIEDNRIENNTAYDDHAGGIAINGTGTITRNIFEGNKVGAGAGNNYSWGWGGAILIFADHSTTTEIDLSHNTYFNNSAPSRGGAVFVDDGATVRMKHELLYNNTSKESGSAIYVDELDGNPSVLDMENCTVSGNSANGGAALYVEKSKAQVKNCIFWNNGSDFEVADGTATANLTVNYTLTQQGYTGTGNISSNPLFFNAAGGDFHLQSKNGRYNPATGTFVNDAADSPAIDAGDPASSYANEPLPNGGRVNMGRYGNTAEASKSAATGMEEITQTEWTLFPNPAKESIILHHPPIGSSVNIIDLTGKTVYSSVIKNEPTIISTAHFANGVYIIQVTDNGVAASRKLLVSKIE